MLLRLAVLVFFVPLSFGQFFGQQRNEPTNVFGQRNPVNQTSNSATLLGGGGDHPIHLVRQLQQQRQQQDQQQQTQRIINTFQNQQPRAFSRLAAANGHGWTGSGGINSPGIFQSPRRNVNRLNAGANFHIQLNGYSNDGLKMRDGKTCYCPREECPLIENIFHPCYFTFTIIVSTASGEPISYISKEFVAVNSTGQPSPSSGDWAVAVDLQLVSKPRHIDIFVNNLGPVLTGRTVNYLDEFWQVDTFTVELENYQPTSSNQQPNPTSGRLVGQLVQSTLDVTYYVQCQAGYAGADCDLTCQPARQTEPPRSICTSRLTNVSSVCARDATGTQVDNCEICGYGVIDDKCADLAAITSRELGVDAAFRVWTIVLAVLLLLLLIAFLILICFVVFLQRRQKRDEQERELARDGQSNNGFGAYDHRPAVSNPLLSTEHWKPIQPPPHSTYPRTESDSTHSDNSPRQHSTTIPQRRREAQV